MLCASRIAERLLASQAELHSNLLFSHSVRQLVTWLVIGLVNKSVKETLSHYKRIRH